MEVKLQTTLILFVPFKKVQRRHYTLHRCALSFASVDDFASEMHRRGWVDRGPVKSRTPPTFKKCSGCGLRNKTKKNFASNQWLRDEPRCFSCAKTSEDLESQRRMVRREAARAAALAAFLRPRPRTIVQGVVLPPPKAEPHPELASEMPTATPTELAAAPKGDRPPKGKKESGTSSSQVKRKQKATWRHRKRFLQQLASLFSRGKLAVWQPGFMQQKMLYCVFWWLRSHHNHDPCTILPEFSMQGGYACFSPRMGALWSPRAGRVLMVRSSSRSRPYIPFWTCRLYPHAVVFDGHSGLIPNGTVLKVQDASWGWIQVAYADAPMGAPDMWVRFTEQHQYNSNYGPYGEFYNDFVYC